MAAVVIGSSRAHRSGAALVEAGMNAALPHERLRNIGSPCRCGTLVARGSLRHQANDLELRRLPAEFFCCAPCVYNRKLVRVGLDVDWRYGAEHMWTGHALSVREANEALTDVDAQLFDPDPKSSSGRSARVAGLLAWWGANGWRANSTDRRSYEVGTQR